MASNVSLEERLAVVEAALADLQKQLPTDDSNH